MGKLLLDADLFGKHVPCAHSSILTCSYESVILLRMPHAIINTGNMALGIGHVHQVHVSSHCGLLPYSIGVVDFGLIISTAAKEVGSIGIERKSSNRVSIERLEVLERLQVSIHGGKVPDFHSVIHTARSHSSSILGHS
jgi:hypothetical protein